MDAATVEEPVYVAEALCGMRVTIERHGLHAGLRVKCCNLAHARRRRFASLSKWAPALGVMASEYLLRI